MVSASGATGAYGWASGGAARMAAALSELIPPNDAPAQRLPEAPGRSSVGSDPGEWGERQAVVRQQAGRQAHRDLAQELQEEYIFSIT